MENNENQTNVENNEITPVEQPKKEKSKNGILNIIVIAALIITAFFGGFAVKGMLKEDDKKDKKEETNKTEEKIDNGNVEEKSDIPIMDSFVFVHEKLFIINNGDVYEYNITDKELTDKYKYTVFSLTHSGCLYDNSGNYCQGNPGYSKKANKIEGLSNIVKLKLYNRPYASDESFSVFAISKEGNVYEINPDAKEISFKEFLNNNDVVDMIGQEQGSYEIVLKNGKHMIYKWMCNYADVGCAEMENSFVYEEKK